MLNRIAKAKNGEGRFSEGGFTLIEMLVVIVILAILTGVVIFGVTGLNDRGQESACAADERTIRTAEEANFVNAGAYVTEAVLFSNGLLVSLSDLHDVTVTGGGTGYTVAAVGDCL